MQVISKLSWVFLVFWMSGVGNFTPRLPLLDGLMKATQKEVVNVGHGGGQVDREVVTTFEWCKSLAWCHCSCIFPACQLKPMKLCMLVFGNLRSLLATTGIFEPSKFSTWDSWHWQHFTGGCMPCAAWSLPSRGGWCVVLMRGQHCIGRDACIIYVINTGIMVGHMPIDIYTWPLPLFVLQSLWMVWQKNWHLYYMIYIVSCHSWT